MTKCFFLLFLMMSISVFGQMNYDYLWMFGYSANSNPQDSTFGTSFIDFNELSESPHVFYDGLKNIDFAMNCAPISDSLGNYLFAFNGLIIEDANGETMKNGESMESGIYNELLIQGAIVLPFPSHSNKYVLIHTSWDFIGSWGAAGNMVLFSIIDMDKNNGAGEVISKKNIVLSDTLDYGKVTATKHANGRDWWIILPKYNSSIYFKFILDPSGVSYIGIEDSGKMNKAGTGQSAFSPDGKYYAKYSIVDQTLGTYFDLYHFDRCNGEISHLQQFHFWKYGIPAGVCFSPNSRYLYISYIDTIYQIDLNNQNYEINVVAHYDGYTSEPGGGFKVPTYFGLLQLGPDGKIYCTPTYSTVREIHSIDRPNSFGVSCSVNQHSISLPTLQQTLPNFPNYRLGPIDESLCDTLGIDNHPKALFRYSVDDSLLPLRITFSDLSYYEPTSWQWKFGDGFTSQEANPIHEYQTSGVYQVCLTVSNTNSSNTYCKNLSIGIVNVPEFAEDAPSIFIYPNPCAEFLTVRQSILNKKPSRVTLTDSFGQLVLDMKLPDYGQRISVHHLPSGIYFWQYWFGELSIQSGKVFKN
ncbi:MAG: PKD domain-containing protein [Saprospiraceae bacterium]